MATERKFTREGMRRVLLKEFMRQESGRAGFGGAHIQRTPMGTRITLVVERPGLVIGRKGSTINRITADVERIYGFDNPQIEVTEEKNSATNANIMAQKVANSLERGWHFRRVGHSTVRRILRSGAKGCQIILAGKLTGDRHRTEKFRKGHIKYCGYPAEIWMDEGFAVAKKKKGIIGVKVWIMRPDARLPDDIRIKDMVEKEVVEKIEDKEEKEEGKEAKGEKEEKKGKKEGKEAEKKEEKEEKKGDVKEEEKKEDVKEAEKKEEKEEKKGDVKEEEKKEDVKEAEKKEEKKEVKEAEKKEDVKEEKKAGEESDKKEEGGNK